MSSALNQAPDDDGYLKPKAAAEFLDVSVQTLERYRLKGGGPPYRKRGRFVRYSKAELRAWMDRDTVTSTSDPGKAA